MSDPSPVALIFGAGANVGQNVGRAFAAEGYKVGLVARGLREEDSTDSQLHIRADLTQPNTIPEIFAKVKSHFGSPHVVVYNAAAASPSAANDPLSVPLEDFTRNLTINTISAFAVAQQAALAFKDLPESASRTFIYTGNCCNVSPIPAVMDLGVGKSATAHIIQCAVEGYADKGLKFYYADERQETGEPVYNNIDGPAHAKHYVELAKGAKQGPWQQTFVKGIGYKKF
ncbi:hypothetical protein GGR57DRAFT_475406 [Xylariaceae sp. FL1272]|nr:hypothetical protein GGR57DRAFT_475406 [Xylariaceae sp. FL1272]